MSMLIGSRRRFLQQSGAGFGLLGLAGALQASEFSSKTENGVPHHAATAKRIIFLVMNGGPSHVDTFDPKPALKKHEGQQPAKRSKKRGDKSGFMPSPFRFAAHGENGVVMSELFPNLATCADELTVVRSMHTDVPNHEPGLLMLNCGNQQPIRPSFGSWASYGLGSENENLPAFVVLSPGRPVVGPQLWSNSFLPGAHQGMAVDTNETDVGKLISNVNHPSLSSQQQRKQLDLLRELNRLHASARQNEQIFEEQIRAMELAFQMQSEATDAFDVQQEPTEMHAAYGNSVFGQSCLMARRLVERGVRVVQVHYVGKSQKQPWDTHSNNDKRHRELCADSDQATAALLKDLRMRGLLDDTLVVWTGEFGRTPYAQLGKKKDLATAGRDHHHTGFSTLLAGGGVKGGFTFGATDDVGMDAVEDRVHIHDLHATILHLMGLDHTKLTYRYSGRDFRLTDVHGRVVNEIIA